MKFSYQWLSEMIDGLDTPAKDLARLITLKTAECEGVEEAGPLLAGAAEALIVAVEPIPSSHNQKATVETMRYGQKHVVCGAPNCRVGVRTVYVPLGKKIIDGVESDGMLASAAELGISRDHSGIVELDAPFTLTPDFVIEVDNKSLTHRPDLWGHHGMAREVAAILGRPLRDPVKPIAFRDAPPAIEVTIDDFALCPRYSALVFENVRVQPSPLWLQYRLEAIGLNPISNIVDVTNFILAELPQPMHAFDADKLRGGIVVRTARAGERIAALNGETYDLDPSNLLITDSSGPIAIAGVIGGAGTAISATTTRIVLESACFNASSVRKTSSRLKLRTDASMRFEKAQDPANTVRGLRRALELLEQVSPGIRLVGGLADTYRPLPEPPAIELPLDWLDRKLGIAVPAAEVRKILESLEFRVTEGAARTFLVTPPTWRATKDVTIKDDLVEEVGRMIGYGSITPVAPLAPARVPPANPEREFQHHVRETAAQQGFTEVHNYSFIGEDQARAFGLSTKVEIANPIASDQHLMRSSLLPGILKNVNDNLKNFDQFRLFEIGSEIHKDREIPHFAAAIYAKDDGVAGLMELKRLAECVIEGAKARPAESRPYEHPRRAAEIVACGAVIGRLFEFHPRMVETGRAAVLDLDLAAIRKLLSADVRYHPLRRFPTAAFDLTVVASARASIGEIESQIAKLAGKELVSTAFLRDFAAPDGSRSLSYRITAGAADRTLESEEVSAIRARIIAGLRDAGFELKV